MIISDDDSGVNRRMTDREMDALLRGPLASFVADLEALATDVPAPSPALAAVLEQGIVPDTTLVPSLPPVRRRRAWLVSVPVAALFLGGTVGAASANALPDGAQRTISDVVSSITPLHLPKPADKPKPTVAPTDRPSEDPVPGVGAQPTLPPVAVSHRPTAVPHGSDDARDGEHRQDATHRDDSHRATPAPLPRPGDDPREGDGSEHDQGDHPDNRGDH